jgi:hypothetical protein
MFVTSASAQELKIIVPSMEDTYSLNARIISKYISKYHPEQPAPVIQAVPGAFSIAAANYLYNVASKDGKTIGTFYKEIPMTGVLGGLNVNFDSSKFTWIGSNADGRKDSMIVWINKNQRIDSFKNEELLVGVDGGGTGHPSYITQRLMGLKFRYINGYPNPAANRLALERKEVDAVFYSLIGIKSGKPNWLLPDSGIYPILQMGNGKTRHVEYPNVPTLFDYLTTKEDMELAEVFETQFFLIRPFAAPPGIPLERTKILRNAFEEAVRDPDYIAEAKKANIDVNLITWKESEELVTKIRNTPSKTLDVLRKYYETK